MLFVFKLRRILENIECGLRNNIVAFRGRMWTPTNMRQTYIMLHQYTIRYNSTNGQSQPHFPKSTLNVVLKVQ